MVARRPSDTLEAFLRRRERIVTATRQTYSRGVWGQIQRYRWFTFHGHIARLQSSYHMATQSLMWRGSRWWQAYRQRLPPQMGGQIGRRAASMSRPMLSEISMLDAPAFLQRSSLWSSVADQYEVDTGVRPHDWLALAQNRPVWRAFSRWCALSSTSDDVAKIGDRRHAAYQVVLSSNSRHCPPNGGEPFRIHRDLCRCRIHHAGSGGSFQIRAKHLDGCTRHTSRRGLRTGCTYLEHAWALLAT